MVLENLNISGFGIRRANASLVWIHEAGADRLAAECRREKKASGW